MKILYVRCSSSGQNSDRQKVHEKDYDYVIEDRISGSVAFRNRPGGMEIEKLVSQGIPAELYVHDLDRIGRSLKDILLTIEYFNGLFIPIHFINQGLITLDESGKENPIAKMIISILGVVAEMERNQLLERQAEGIKIAKFKGTYKGRKSGSSEDVVKFLSKPNNRKALEYLKKGYSHQDISKIVGVHHNTITKIKKLGLPSVS